MPDQSTPTAPAQKKTAAQLESDYRALIKAVQEADAKGRKLEHQLLEEVKLKVKSAAGDLDKLKERKRSAFIAWEAQKAVEAAQAEAEKIKASAAAK